MTREEEILEYANSFNGKGMESEELKEIIRLAIIDGAKWADNHPIKPSLPSNLDEAAEEYSKQVIEETKCHHNALTYAEGYEDALLLIPDAFIAGAQYVTSRWISVDESLPEMDEEVIVLTDELGSAPIYKIGFGHIVDVDRCIDYNGWNCPGVKYWMPCPEIPNSD